ncbi:uncharacterized protein EV154DRAFT_557222 [Mucor mucedo]|uniref:uncharacterized protein n=1 Tax=Mucor mucedo TaxID=29922 RepID=UPI00221E3C7F|nr:uncharacterized protein EV154DRAFT_557222 [Mucor mucedo]KAI7865389.1 hypothetical protein EV154DRAFT_557222 [Mucor mucedo]
MFLRLHFQDLYLNESKGKLLSNVSSLLLLLSKNKGELLPNFFRFTAFSIKKQGRTIVKYFPVYCIYYQKTWENYCQIFSGLLPLLSKNGIGIIDFSLLKCALNVYGACYLGLDVYDLMKMILVQIHLLMVLLRLKYSGLR